MLCGSMPGGLGGTLWIMGLVGGYVIDMMIRVKQRERDFALGYYQGGVR